MREILFRAKRLDNGEWVEGFYVCLNGIEHMIYNGYAETDCGEFYPDFFQVDPETVCQYTGLTDKNGNKIWENNILSEDWGNDKGIVRFGDFKSIMLKNVGFNIEWICEIYYRQDLRYWAEKCEVVGNIFDNPELMEGGVADET